MQSHASYSTAGLVLPRSLTSSFSNQKQNTVDTLNALSAEKEMSSSHVNQKTQIWYTSVLPVFAGLATLPCHGLVDTGAQDGVC
eukprot:8888103-Karenia_brevis.AAC.1